MAKKLEVLRQKNEQIRKLKNEAYEISKTIFEQGCQEIFDKYESLGSFSWNQYTPYFNDGDTCVFSANTDYIKVNGEYAQDSEWYSETNVTSWGTYNREAKKYEGRVETPNPSYDAELSKASDEIQDFLSNFDNDFYMERFGDHTEITIGREGIEVEECEHD